MFVLRGIRLHAGFPAWGLALLLAWAWVGHARAAEPANEDAASLGTLVERLHEAEASVIEAERAAARELEPSETQLAKQLVAGQLQLVEGDYEGAAIKFLDLVLNYPSSQAGPQAVYFLGEALTHLDMERWAVELFSKNLADGRPEAKRFHQRSVACLLDLALPRREPGFARKPGLSATPEVRARLEAVGVKVDEAALARGVVSRSDAEKLVRWAESFPADAREPALRYAYGRYLFLTRKYARAREELDVLNPLDVPLSRGGPDAAWRVRSAYLAAASSVGLEEYDDALVRFEAITRAHPSDPRDRQIVELAWLGIARTHHDLGDVELATQAYRALGRDSPFFPEAMYETAWTLLAAERYDQAIASLDQLLVYDPSSPIVPEIKHLRGKIKIQGRDYQGAATDFSALHREFAELREQLARKLRVQGDAADYFAAVVGAELEHFSLGSILPAAALPVARGLARVAQAESLARDVGHLDRELTDLLNLLARMEEAVGAREKARLFNDLGGHVASLDHVDRSLFDLREQLLLRLRTKGRRNATEAEGRRKALRKQLDRPLGTTASERRSVVATLEHLRNQAHKLDLIVSGLRAELVALERRYEETRGEQKVSTARSGPGVDHTGYLKAATELRHDIAALERESAALRDRIARAQGGLRFVDPLRAAHRERAAEYESFLVQMYGALANATGDADPDGATMWRRIAALQTRADAARTALEGAADKRLATARKILEEERANLDRYAEELGVVRAGTRVVVGEVIVAAYQDVVGEVANLVMRSEVGLLDVAWSMKEAESKQVDELERSRDRELGELDRAVDLGLEDLSP